MLNDKIDKIVFASECGCSEFNDKLTIVILLLYEAVNGLAVKEGIFSNTVKRDFCNVRQCLAIRKEVYFSCSR